MHTQPISRHKEENVKTIVIYLKGYYVHLLIPLHMWLTHTRRISFLLPPCGARELNLGGQALHYKFMLADSPLSSIAAVFE